MSIGLRVGAVVGEKIGPAVGLSEDSIGGLAGVTFDALSGKYAPANSTEWAIVLSAAGITSGGPSLLWLCQEASGNLADSIGTFTGTMTGAPVTYQQPITGWSRKGIQGSDSGTGLGNNQDSGLPDASVASMLSIGYSILNSPVSAGTKFISAIGSGSTNIGFVTGKIQVVSSPNASVGLIDPIGPVRPYGILHDVTNNRVAGWDDREIIAISRGTTTAKQLRIFFGFPGSHLYRAAFFNSAAELTNNQIRRLLQTLGWVIAW